MSASAIRRGRSRREAVGRRERKMHDLGAGGEAADDSLGRAAVTTTQGGRMLVSNTDEHSLVRAQSV
ncbi:hypothetical protein GUJ93_ZPchr0013g36991 [Zizania palustris]|uniref:Uncharacterized protein n=1 Tax=Zizania palustris TaxID=103762 RepID=A0A8J5X231_ZIZPA|nr:hypothetical protein GUJ93_ZPchr0013g36991 [Zizania palustris]